MTPDGSSGAVGSTGDGLPVERLRAETPGVDHVVHLNNAGSSLPPTVVIDTVVDHLRREAEIGGYEAAAEAADRTDGVYASIARLIGARADQIAIVENATIAWDLAVHGYPFRPGDRVLTSRAEYAANVIALLQLRRRHGIEIVQLDDDEHGQVSLDHLDRELDLGAVMVALTHLPTNDGLVNPAAEVGARCRAHDVLFVLDACQAAGHVPLDVEAIGCDVLSATGRKYLRGPRGTGFLYVGRRAFDALEPPFLDLHAADWTGADTYEMRGDARRFESWETNHATRLGLGAAVDHLLELGVDASWERVRTLGDALRARLGEVPGLTVRDRGLVRSGIVTFSHDRVGAEEVQAALSARRINTSVAPTTVGRWNREPEGHPPLVRASVHHYNTESELDRLVEVLDSLG
ncbi:MAG: aminotransferase class V-fold PLP-dependent enzyme [Actinomycetota bacterium]